MAKCCRLSGPGWSTTMRPTEGTRYDPLACYLGLSSQKNVGPIPLWSALLPWRSSPVMIRIEPRDRPRVDAWPCVSTGAAIILLGTRNSELGTRNSELGTRNSELGT